MSRFHSHIKTAKTIIESYKGEQPFAAHIKSFFAADKKYGSGDRRKISHYCYCFFRIRHLFPQEDMEHVLLKGLFLTGQEVNEGFPDDWKKRVGESATDKLVYLGKSPEGLFPLLHEVSSKLNRKQFCLSLLEQPRLFLRIRPGKKERVMQSLVDAGCQPVSCGEDCLSLPNGSSLDKVIQLDKDAVIQDLNSQRVLDELERLPLTGPLHVWDCCAGSGGKSILLFDKLRAKNQLRITVTDIRETILKNLRLRLSRSGVPVHSCLVKDVSAAVPFKESFHLIIGDLPCSGSGTWGRTPEQMSFFTEEQLIEFSEKQKKIAENALTCLIPGGLFFYITCSVFHRENEEVVAYLKEKHSLQLLNECYHVGYEKQADTLYVAVLRR